MSGAASVGGRRIVRDVGAQVVGYGLNLGLGVVATLAVVRALGDRAYGQWATLLVISQLVQYVADPGIESAVVKRAAAEPEREPTWLGALFSLRFMLGGLACAVYALVVLVIARSSDMRVAGLLVAGTVLLLGPLAVGAIWKLHVRNHIQVAAVTANSVLWTAGVLAIAWAGGGMVPLAAAMLGIGCLVAGAELIVARRSARVQLSGTRRLWSPVLRTGVSIGLANFLILAYGKIDQVLVFEQAGSRDAGLYGAVYRVLSQGTYLPFALTTTLYPILAASRALDMSRIRRLLQQGAEYMLMVALPVLAFAIVEAREVVKLLFGAEFADAAPALPILMAAFVPISIWYLASTAMIALDRERRLAAYAAGALVLNVVLNLIFIPKYGFLAAAWITLATEILVVVLTTRVVLRETGLRPRLGRLPGVLLAAGIFGLGLWGLDSAGAGLALAALFAALAYPLLLFALRVVTPQELRVLVRQART